MVIVLLSIDVILCSNRASLPDNLPMIASIHIYNDVQDPETSITVDEYNAFYEYVMATKF